MFENVFDDKQWKTARDATGLKGGLTEKVSMGEEFKKFQQTKTLAAAKILQQKIALYETQLKTKHSKDKYYTRLLAVVQSQKTLLETGIEEAEHPVQTPPQVIPQGNTLPQGYRPQVNPPQQHTVNPPQQTVNPPQHTVNPPQQTVNPPQHTVNPPQQTVNPPQRQGNAPQQVVDPNAPSSISRAWAPYMKLTKEFPTVQGQLKSDLAATTQLLQRCQTLGTTPNLLANADKVNAAAEMILDSLNKIEEKASDLRMDFDIEGQVVEKEEGREHRATKELARLSKLLGEEMSKIAQTGRACRLSLKNALQVLGNNPKAQEILRKLHV